jgi:hypothetical protein
MSKTVLAVRIAGMSAFSASKARLVFSAGNRLITPRANRIDRRIVVATPRKRNKDRHLDHYHSCRWPLWQRLENFFGRAANFTLRARILAGMFTIARFYSTLERILSAALLRKLSICPP